MAAVLLGLVLPFGILYLLKLTDTKIHNRNELRLIQKQKV